MKFARNILLAALILPALPALADSAAPQYTITDLGVVAGQTYSQTFGISSNGSYVVGRTLTAEGQAGPWPTFLWNAQTGMVSEGNIAGRDYAWGYGVNNSGVAVGVSSTNTTGAGAIPVMWQGGTATALTLPAGQVVGHAYDINNGGIAVGSVGSGVSEQGAIYNTATGTTTVIGALSPEGSYMQTALGISDNGLIVGAGVDGNSLNVALVYNSNDGSMMQLQMPAYGGTNSSLAFSISANGEYVVGTSGNGTQPFIWSAATGALVAALPSISSGGSLDAVNNMGWAVGTTGGQYANPVLVEDGQTFLINDIVVNGAGWNFTTTTSASARGISDAGQIVGTAQYNGIEHAYLLTPVPEPTTWALMLGGLVAIGAASRRRTASCS